MSDASRLAICTSELGRGGPEGVMLTIARHLDRRRFEPILLVESDDGPRRADVPTDVPVYRTGGFPTRYPLTGLIRLFREYRPDVVLATHRMTAVAVAAALFVRPRPRVVARPANFASLALSAADGKTGLKHRIADAVDRMLISRADAIVSQSAAMTIDIEARLPSGGRRAVVRHIDNPIDTAETLQRAESGLVPSMGDPALITVGRLAAQKGVDRLLHAFAVVARTNPGARLWIVGDGPERPALMRLTHELAVEDRVCFTGHVEEPLPMVAAAALFVSASLWEGLSNALIEAQALGVPAVAFDGPASGDMVVVDGVTGLIVEQGNADDLADTIAAALATSWDADKIRAHCEERFGATTTVSRYMDILEPERGR